VSVTTPRLRDLSNAWFLLRFGYWRVAYSALLGKEVVSQMRETWGLDEEGEVPGLWRKSGVPGLWVMNGMCSQLQAAR
jgi:hypothetical protein